MKLNKTPDQWAEIIRSSNWTDSRREMVIEDLATLFSKVDRLTAQLAEAEQTITSYDALAALHIEMIHDLRAQLDEREGIARELADAIEIARANDVWTHVDAALARFHAAEDKSHDA